MTAIPLLEGHDIVKYAYDGDGRKLRGTTVKLLSSVSFELRPGEIHALVGENGAGKTTLIKVIAGAIELDGGELSVAGKPHAYRSTAAAREDGIAVIWQELNLVPRLSVWENMFLGRELRRGGRLDKRAMVEQAAAALQVLGAEIDPRAQVCQLSTSQQQVVEIAKAISQDVRVLILDEPTASLSRFETERLFGVLGDLRSRGIGIVLVTHRLDEIFQMADRATVLKDGQTIGTCHTADTTADQLIEMMVGRRVASQYARRCVTTERTVLEVDSVVADGATEPLSIEVRAGEIVGLAGLVGSGRTELARAIVGAEPVVSGHVRLGGQDITRWPLRRRLDAGIAFVPEDRKTQGLVLPLSIEHNLTLASLASLGPGPWVEPGREKARARTLVSKLGISARDVREPVNTLSGGNQQRVVIGKWFDRPRELYVLDEPTRGVDVNARYAVYELMQAIAEAGGAILMISSDMPEVIGMADRIYVMRQGAISGHFVRDEFDEAVILERMFPDAAGGEAA